MAREIRKTKAVTEAIKLAEVVMGSDNAIGEIVGPAGTGKSMAGRAVCEAYRAARIVAFDGMTRHQLLRAVAQAAGIEGPGAVDRLLAAPEGDTRRLIVVDEANKLGWRPLEALRFLADERGFAVLLIGTELYERQFAASRTRELLLQLGSRIGAKRMSTRHLDRAETYAHVLRPAFGDVADKELINAFWMGCRKGNYREAVELAEECRRIMAANQMQNLTSAVLELALKWSANRRVVGRDGHAA
ncbi:ATP-binding protein [Thiobacter aerophilum]|uniref:ATP-binding protein n=1 Tax=Thiobacter aerophilum TaxID=3121275 RepID=A0ABV0EHA8_9BURK